MIGETLSHYKILEKLGEGGMGEVYRAHDTSKLDRDVALKVLPEELARDPERLKRFEREAAVIAALNHPNIVTIHSIEEAGGLHFITMELVKGQTLSDVIPAGGLALARFFDLAVPLVDAVSSAHAEGVAHRDLKPANIMLDEQGRVKVLDFGLAKLFEKNVETDATVGPDSDTGKGQILGTVAYMSPEQAEGKPIDHRSDVFSLGIILYEMATGERPFKGETNISTLSSILKDTPPSVTEVKQSLPRHVGRIVNRCLAKSPDRRYQSVLDLRNDLRDLKEEGEQSAGAESTAAAKPRRILLKYGLPASVVFLAVLVILILKPFKFEISPDHGAVAGENRLAVMYFENLVERDDPGHLGEIATNLLITDLSESKYMKVLSSQRLYDILKLKGKEGIKLIDRHTATEVAVHAGASQMLLGSILQVEPNFLLTSQLVDVRTGEVTASQRITGDPGEKIFSLVDKLSREIKGDLSLPEAARDEQDLRVAEVTTH